MLNEEHWNVFQECFPQPVQQGPVGRAPASYLNELTAEWQGPIPAANNRDLALNRDDLRNLWARNPDCGPLQAYAAVMAWGGRDFHNYRLSIAAESIRPLVELLEYLREGNRTREEDFSNAKNKAQTIRGLGISFYTKLLYFFREDADAYILDQWTAKSVNLLFRQCPIRLNQIGLPHPQTSAGDYKWYCSALECLGHLISPANPWSGAQVEQCLFDASNGAWRKYVRQQFAGGINGPNIVQPPPEPPYTDEPLPGGDPNHNRRLEFARFLSKINQSARAAGVILPGRNSTVGAQKKSKSVRVNCGVEGGVSWLYEINLKSINAKAFVPSKLLPEFQDWLDFLEGIDHVRVTRDTTGAARIIVGNGVIEPRSEWPAIAGMAVTSMALLFQLWQE